MSFNYRFEPPTLSELEDGVTLCPYDFQCKDCEWDCDLEGDAL